MIALIADIHGNYPALQAVLNEIDSLDCDEIISLGDVAGYYCMVNECIDVLRQRAITHLMGNHDKYITSRTHCARSRSANLCLDYQQEKLTDINRRWLEKSPERFTIKNASFVHGGWNDPIDEYLVKIHESYFEPLADKFFFSGHTHVQALVQFSEKVYCNPGSVGQPRDGDPRAAYAIFDNGDISLRRVKYDVNAISKAMQIAGFEPGYSSNLYTGTRIGGNLTSVTITKK